MMTESEYFSLLTPEMRLKYIGQRVAIIRRNLEEFSATYAGMQGNYAEGKVDGLKCALNYLNLLSAVEARQVEASEPVMAEAP